MQFDYYVEIRDSDGIILDRFFKNSNMLISFEWEYSRIGGCGSFAMKTQHTIVNPPRYIGRNDVRLYILNINTKSYTLWYRGILEQSKISIEGSDPSVFSGKGYSIFLTRLTKNGTYTDTEISVIVKDLLDSIILPNTDITYLEAQVEATGYTIDSITFNNRTIAECIETLADIAGAYEFGVDKNARFYFLARETTSSFFALPGVNIIKYSLTTDYNKIVNRIKLEGGESGGSKFTRTINDLSSQGIWGLAEKIMQNSAIITNDVADRYGASILAELSVPVQRGSMKLLRNLASQDAYSENIPIENTLPIPPIQVRSRGIKLGEKQLNTFLLSGPLQLIIQSINYGLMDYGLDVSLTLGKHPPDLALILKQIEFELGQNRQRST